jgi:hypothetical protein
MLRKMTSLLPVAYAEPGEGGDNSGVIRAKGDQRGKEPGFAGHGVTTISRETRDMSVR